MIYFLKKAAIREDLYLFSINQLSFDLLKKKLLSSELKEKNIEIFLEFFELYRKKIQFYSYSKDQFKKDRIFSKKIMNRKEEFLIFNQLKVYELKLKDFLFSIPNHLFFVEKFLTSNFSRDFFLKKTKNEYIGYHFHLKKPFISNNKIQTFKFFFLLREIKKILKQDQKQIHKKSDFDFLFKKYIKSASLEMQHFDFSFKVIHLFIFIYELNLKDYILLKIEYDFLKYLFKNKKVSKRLIQLFFTIKKRLLIKKRINQFFKKNILFIKNIHIDIIT